MWLSTTRCDLLVGPHRVPELDAIKADDEGRCGHSPGFRADALIVPAFLSMASKFQPLANTA